jgi:hypothetical protein
MELHVVLLPFDGAGRIAIIIGVIPGRIAVHPSIARTRAADGTAGRATVTSLAPVLA